MSISADNRPEKRANIGLRPVKPVEISTYFDNNFDSQVRVQFAPKGDIITIPEDWHGAGKEGEVLVHVGNLLTEPIAGTSLNAKDFLQWSLSERFSLMDGNNARINIQEAIQVLEGSDHSTDGKPLFKMVQTISGKTPIEIQFYGGGTNQWLQKLSEIGNKKSEDVNTMDKNDYRYSVKQLLVPFISKGTKIERSELGLPDYTDILRRVDDCSASGVTFIGDQVLDDAMQISRDNLVEVHDISVATLQSVVLGIEMADRRHVPLIMRIGSPAFGLGTGNNLNYMVNTLPIMRKYGHLAVGDMGNLMDDGTSKDAQPELFEVRNNDASREARLFLGGGLTISRILREVHKKREKPVKWDIAIRRASRVNKGLDHWAVLISGTNVTMRTDRCNKILLPPNTELSDLEQMPWNVTNPKGLWVSPGEAQGGFIPVTFVDRGSLITLYLPEKAR